MFVPAALCLSVIFTGCGTAEKKEEKEAAAASTAVPAAEAFLLQKGKLSASIQIPGELIPFQQVDIYARVNGFVKKLYEIGRASCRERV